ncbi:hypothetical protein SISNIDRAFT_419042 [Sistotremastrum niveocremeum HHB9708]|uniref:Uncharacterized protein n=1 Tax=Sistotremastrum niveocremeum HHB9708 TaxID=1314777 RepID=A0A164NLR6_9AGAM|nr:hypothetical protein SISNIDRAFT_419042 [Sistotremastrum niveocremeum HHB9708]
MPNPNDAPIRLQLPDILSNWPFTRTINPHYKLTSPLSTSWFTSFKPLPSSVPRSSCRDRWQPAVATGP